MFAVARTYGAHCEPALNVVSPWHAFAIFCECVKEKRPVSVVSVTDCNMRAIYDTHSGRTALTLFGNQSITE